MRREQSRPPARSCDHCPGSHTGALACHATATAKAGAWLLVEHPGPWAENAADTALPRPVAEVVAAAPRHGVRVQLIRRPGRRRATPPLQVYACRSYGGDVWIEGRELADPAELAGLDLAAVGSGVRPGFGTPEDGPLFLVCTHGRHNACCARTGAPLARDLAARFGDRVWETTHLGGDRYAANLACLPHGLYYGDLTAETAAEAVEAYLSGAVVPGRLRGRAGLPEPAQAAEHYVRDETGIMDVAGVTAESVTSAVQGESNGPGTTFVSVVSARGSRYRVTVEQSAAAHPCGSDCNESVRSYRLLDLTLLNEAALV